jgi:hypothetical protein
METYHIKNIPSTYNEMPWFWRCFKNRQMLFFFRCLGSSTYYRSSNSHLNFLDTSQATVGALLSFHTNMVWVVWFLEFKSIVRVQRGFHCVYQQAAPDAKTQRGGQQRVSDEKVQNIHTAFIRRPRKSICRPSQELQMTWATMLKVLWKQLCLYVYKVQILQEMKPEDTPWWHNFACDMLDWICRDPKFLTHVFQQCHFSCLWCCKQAQRSMGITATTHHHGKCARQPKSERLAWYHVQYFLCEEDCHR